MKIHLIKEFTFLFFSVPTCLLASSSPPVLFNAIYPHPSHLVTHPLIYFIPHTSGSMQFMSKKEQQARDLKAVLAKDIGANNPVFSLEFITQLHAMFILFADPRNRRADIRDILLTAKTLNLDTKYQIVYQALQQICKQSPSSSLDFQEFLHRLTKKVGNPYSEEGRRANFALLDQQGKQELDISDLRYINQQLHYGYTEDELKQLIQSVGGFGANTITSDRWNKIIAKRIQNRKIG